MQLQIRAILIRLIATIALVGLYSRVHQHMLRQVVRKRKPLAAQLALERLQPVVNSLVRLEIGSVGKGMAAHLADVRVELQGRRSPCECGSTEMQFLVLLSAGLVGVFLSADAARKKLPLGSLHFYCDRCFFSVNFANVLEHPVSTVERRVAEPARKGHIGVVFVRAHVLT